MISGPGATAGPMSVTVSSNTQIFNLSVATISTTSGGNWLCADISGTNTVNVYIGSGPCSVPPNTTLTAPNQNYTGTIGVRINGGTLSGTINVSLSVGATQMTFLVAASPSSVSFNATQGEQVPAQNVQVTVNGSLQAIRSFSFAPTSALAFLNTTLSGSTATLSVIRANLGAGVYAGILTLETVFGSVNVPVTLSIVLGASSSVVVSPSSVSLVAAPGGQVVSQSVSVTVAGDGQTPFSAFATTSQGGAWLSVTPSNGIAPETLTVSANGIINGFLLQPGTYQGHIAISSPGSTGLVTVPVSLTIAPSNTAGLINAGSFAHLASAGFWKTIITLYNTGSVSSQARLNFFDDNGTPLPLPLTFPQFSPLPQSPSTTLDRTLGAGSTLIIEITGQDNQVTRTGSAQLLTGGNINGFAVFRQTVPSGQHEAVVPLESRNAGAYVLAFDNTSGFITGVAVSNAGTAAFITVTIRDDNGLILQSNTVGLAAQGHTQFDLAARFPVTAQRRGTVEFQTPAGGQISLLGIRFNPAGTFSTVPPAAK